MSGVLAVFNRTEAPVALPVVQAMLDAGRHRAIDGQHVWHSGTVALAHQHFWVAPEEVGEAQPLVNDDGLAVACDARLDNRKDVIADLKLDVDPRKGISDAALILYTYARWGPACVEHLLGDFAFILWDPIAQHLFLARDGLGGRELYYYLADTCCVVASEIKQVLSHPAVPRRLNEGKVAEYLAGVWHSQDETFFAGIQSCPPAHWLAVSSQAVDKRRYWDVDLAARIRYRSDADYAAHFRTLLTDAVRDRLRTIGPVGFSLSGGLDSTTLVALAASLLPQTTSGQARLRSFSYVFDELSECDERAFIEPVVRRFDLEAQYLPSDQRWTLRDVENWPGSPDAVTGDAYVLLFLAILQAAHDNGCRLLFNGQFGDSLFAGGRTWAADLLRELRLSALVGTIARCRGSFAWRRDAGTYGVW